MIAEYEAKEKIIGSKSPGPLSVRQRNAILMAFRWRADSGLLLKAYWDCR